MRGRILLQDLQNHRFLTSDGGWRQNCQNAKSFEHTYQALFVGLSRTDRRTQVVWCFGDQAKNLYLAVRPGDPVYRCPNCPSSADKGL